MEPIKMTREELITILEKVEDKHAEFIRDTEFKFNTSEMICYSMSQKIAEFLTSIGIPAKFTEGTYLGRGTCFSGGDGGTYHCWVELQVLLDNGYERYREMKVIIDGAYAQFFPYGLSPERFRNRIRLMFFIGDKEAEKWYQYDKSKENRTSEETATT